MIKDTTEDTTTVPLLLHLHEVITEDITTPNAATMIIVNLKNPLIIVIEVIVAIDMRRTTTLATTIEDTERKETKSLLTRDLEIANEETTPHQVPKILTNTNIVTVMLRSQTRRKKQLAVRTILATVQSKKENEDYD